MIIFYKKDFYTNMLEKMIKTDRIKIGKEFNFLGRLVSLGIAEYKKDYKHKGFRPLATYYISDKYMRGVLDQLGIFIHSSKVCDLKDLS